MNETTTRKPIIHIKGEGQLSAESIVTARVSVEQYDEDNHRILFFQVTITAPPADLYMFLMPFRDDPNVTMKVEIIDVHQPKISRHEDNLKFLDALTQLTLLTDDDDNKAGEPQ